jgi:hypothetical protein
MSNSRKNKRPVRPVSKSARVDLEGIREFLMLVATLYLALTIATVIAAFAGAIAAYVFISRDFDLLKTPLHNPPTSTPPRHSWRRCWAFRTSLEGSDEAERKQVSLIPGAPRGAPIFFNSSPYVA